MSELIVPKHIGFIMDGNRRWAKKHGLPVYEGHMAGYNIVKDISTVAFDAGIKYLSVYAFSTENWKRSEEEVSNLMSLILNVLVTDLPIFEKKNVKIVVLGTREKLSERVIGAIETAEQKTKDNTSGTLAICFNYGGHQEIVDATKKIIESGVKSEDITAELISQNLYAPEVPPVDILIRTSGEQRISNYMLWRVAYSELLFLDKMWPEMTPADVTKIIREYSKRNRRHGS